MANNPVRSCLGCGQSDDHPRHVVDIGGTMTANFHMDCHVQLADCEVCAAQIADAKGAKGDELRAHLLKTGTDPKSPGWTPPGDPDTRKAAR
jgi:hypothetical protein